jgi:hypothetical protein
VFAEGQGRMNAMKRENAAAAAGKLPGKKPEKRLRKKRIWKREKRERVFTAPFMWLSVGGVLAFYILPFLVVMPSLLRVSMMSL